MFVRPGPGLKRDTFVLAFALRLLYPSQMSHHTKLNFLRRGSAVFTVWQEHAALPASPLPPQLREESSSPPLRPATSLRRRRCCLHLLEHDDVVIVAGDDIHLLDRPGVLHEQNNFVEENVPDCRTMHEARSKIQKPNLQHRTSLTTHRQSS